MSETEKKIDTKAVRDEISKIKAKLNIINDEKEKLFSDKSEVSKKITLLIGGVKDSRIERNEKTRKVSELKEERRKLNSEIKEKIIVIKEANNKKIEILKKHSIKEDPIKIKKEIESIELTINTIPMSIEKEQKLMKRLHFLKTSFNKVGEVSEVFSQTNTLSKNIDKLKKEADKIHKLIQTNANISQEKHENMIGMSKEIDELKKLEKELHDKFMLKKKEFNELNVQLKQKLGLLSDKKSKIIIVKKKAAAKKKEEQKKDLKEKSKEVNDKIKKGKKLTTEDLLIFQADNINSKSSKEE